MVVPRMYEDGLIVTEQTDKEVVQHGQTSSPYSHSTYNPSPQPPLSESTYQQSPSEHPPYQPGDNVKKPSPRPVAKRKATWVIVGLLVVIIVLVGVLGGVASGSIKTEGNSQSDSSVSSPVITTPAPTPTESTGPAPPENPQVNTTTLETKAGTVVIECPSADELEYTVRTDRGEIFTFMRHCDTNYPGNDLGLVKKAILSMPECLEECSETTGCVGAVFNSEPQCWLKNGTGRRTVENRFNTEAAVLAKP